MRKDVVAQYLAHYAEREISLTQSIAKRFGHVIVIPAYGEGSDFFETLRSIPPGICGDVLVIAIVNAPESGAIDLINANAALLSSLQENARDEQILSNDPTARLTQFEHLSLLVVDRSSTQPIPPKEGVGLARKIGCDIALQLWRQNQITSPWLHCTDADAILPDDYFAQTDGASRSGSASAYVYPFQHLLGDDPVLNQAILRYDTKLRLYQQGLENAGSPYAYHCLGSTIAVDTTHYAMVRGFPKRAAGEDFYVLNKLNKVGAVISGQGKAISLRARRSSRVPFGTGPALENLIRGETEQAIYYHPIIFRYLRGWISTLEQVAIRPDAQIETIADETLDGDLNREILWKALRQLDALEAIEPLTRQYPDATSRRRALHVWFDAFRTLKLIHILRDSAFPSMTWTERTQAPVAPSILRCTKK